MENRDRVLQQERTQIITQGLSEGKGERAIQLELEQLETKDLSLRIDELSAEIAKITCTATNLVRSPTSLASSTIGTD